MQNTKEHNWKICSLKQNTPFLFGHSVKSIRTEDKYMMIRKKFLLIVVSNFVIFSKHKSLTALFSFIRSIKAVRSTITMPG